MLNIVTLGDELLKKHSILVPEFDGEIQTLTEQMFETMQDLPEYDATFQIIGQGSVNQAFGGVLLKPWDRRKRSSTEIQNYLQQKWNHIAGARFAAFQFPALPGAQGLPLQFVITTTEPVENLYEVANEVLAKANASGLLKCKQ